MGWEMKENGKVWKEGKEDRGKNLKIEIELKESVERKKGWWRIDR